jgi:predicted phage-related endonuclease
VSKDITHIAPVINQMREIKDTIQRLNERYELLKNTVIEELAGETEAIIDGEVVASHTSVTQYRVDVNWLQTNMPEVYETARKPSTSSRFTLVTETRDNG